MTGMVSAGPLEHGHFHDEFSNVVTVLGRGFQMPCRAVGWSQLVPAVAGTS